MKNLLKLKKKNEVENVGENKKYMINLSCNDCTTPVYKLFKLTLVF